jgi:hypothetical protein
MRLGNSICLIAFGAALTFAVHAPNDRIDIGVVGLIVMLVGIVSIFLSPYDWNRPANWSSFAAADRTRSGDAPMAPEPPITADPPVVRDRPLHTSLRIVERSPVPGDTQQAHRAS